MHLLTMAGVSPFNATDSPVIISHTNISLINVTLFEVKNISFNSSEVEVISPSQFHSSIYIHQVMYNYSKFTVNSSIVDCFILHSSFHFNSEAMNSIVTVNISDSSVHNSHLDTNGLFLSSKNKLVVGLIRNTLFESSLVINQTTCTAYNQPVGFVVAEINDCRFIKSSSVATGLYVNTYSDKTSVKISNSFFNQSLSLSVYGFKELEIQILDTNIRNTHGAQVKVEYPIHNPSKNELHLRNVSFTQNFADMGALYIVRVKANLINCSFDNNKGVTAGALNIQDADLLLTGNTNFSNNIGKFGGAIHMSKSKMLLDRNTNIMFINNSATDKGGAIFLSGKCQQAVTNEFPTCK